MLAPPRMSEPIARDMTDIALYTRCFFPISPGMGIINKQVLALATALVKGWGILLALL
jgi:hypothetical protein